MPQNGTYSLKIRHAGFFSCAVGDIEEWKITKYVVTISVDLWGVIKYHMPCHYDMVNVFIRGVRLGGKMSLKKKKSKTIFVSL